MNQTDKNLLNEISPTLNEAEVYNIRKNGESIARQVNSYVSIIPKEDKSGLDIYVKENTLFGIIHIPVIITKSGLKETVYNDFHIGKNANVIILAGCGIHSDEDKMTAHDGIHRFFLEENAKVKYVEKHFGNGKGKKRNLNPTTEIIMKKSSTMNMDSTQIKGVDNTIRITNATLEENATLEISEKILTSGNEQAKTEFNVTLNGENASVHVTSRSVAENNSFQEFKSSIIGNTKCYAHVECDAIIKDNGMVKAIPEIYAKNIDANLIHEAAIGKIAGDELNKLMSLGLNESEAEEVIIKGFLK